MRTSKVHYIAPSAISITPNANGSHRDLAVYIARGAKIKVHSKGVDRLGVNPETNSYREWQLEGRNRRLADTTGNIPYTIYARLPKSDNAYFLFEKKYDNAYLVFARQYQYENDNEQWFDKYSYVTQEGLAKQYDEQGLPKVVDDENYWWIKLGTVSAVGENGQRTVTLDTGILGTDQYNEEWNLNPDDMPLRVELSCTVDGEDAGPTPYLYWGQSALLAARIVEGWTADASAHVHHWTITRRIGNEEVLVASSDSSDSNSSGEEEAWPGNFREALFNSSQVITLYHINEENDDFLSATGAVFKVTAWGTEGPSITDSSDSSSSSDSSVSDSSTDDSDSSAEETTYIPLGAASINIYVETDIIGINGDSSIAIFRWYKDGLSPVKPVDTSSAEPNPAPTDHTGSANVYPESKWSRTAPNRPSEGEWALWMCTSTRHGNGIIEAWSDPVRISGTKGTPGEDAKEREWIYKLGNSDTLPSAPQTLSVTIGAKTVDGHTIDDYVPEGWEDNAQVISQNQRFLYACWRDWNKTTERWGDFQGPIFWSVWGERGIDGDGVQYVFKLYDHELTNSERTNYIPVKPASMNSNEEWLPAGRNSNDPNTAQSWTDDPESPTAALPYCYCSTIKKVNNTWGTYEKLSLWSRYSTDGVSQPGYTKTQEAWSNDAVTASETTAPATAHGTTNGTSSHAAEQDWSDSTPSNPNNLPYLWRRSRQMVLNAQTRQYDYATGSNWIYTRLNGTNGTSINTKGTVVCAIKATDSLPAVSGYSTGDLLIKQGNATPYKLTSGQWSQTGMSAAADGDSYTVTKDCTVDLDGDGTAENIKGHLVMWSEEASKWIDLGQFKGENGVTYYTHIAWAKVVTLGTPTDARSTGQKTTPNASSVSSASGNFSIGVPPANDSDEWPWMGWLVDQVTADSTNPLLYTWRNVLGPEGNGIASVTRTYARSTQSTSTNDTTPPTGIDTTIGTNGWATTSPAVSESYPYLWAKELVVYTRHNVTTTKYYMIGARGQNGIDAQDAEWAYVRTKDYVAPEVVDDGNYTDSYSNGHTADDHLPKVKVAQAYNIYGNTHYDTNGYKTQTISSVSCHVAECTDDPQGVNTNWPYEWEIKRTKGNADTNGHRTWNAYSGSMTLHNSLAESALVMDIDNDSDQFGVDADGKVLTQQTRTTVATLLYGSVEQAFLHDTGNAPTATLYYENGNTVPSAVATAAIDAVTGSDYKQYRVTVTVKATGNNTVVFGNGSGQHSGMYVLITGSCAKGGPKSIRFSLTKVMSGASGENPIIYQLAPSGKTFSFSRDSLNELTPNARSVNVYVMRTIGNTTTKFTSPTSPETLTNPPTFSWGFDTETTKQQDNQAIGTAIEISNTQANLHYQIWVQLSTGDRETLPIVKDGTNGATAYLADLDNEMDSISCDNTGYPVTQQTVSTPIHMYYGSGSIGFTVLSVTRNGTAVTLGSQSNGVTVSFSNGTLSVAYATTAKIQNGKDDYVITLHPSGVSSTDHSNDRVLTFTVNAVIGYVYNLNPSPSQIRVQSNTTSFPGLTCGYKKNINGVVSEHTLPSQSTNGFFIDGKYNIYYRYRQKSDSAFESTYRLFSSSTTIGSLNVATYDAVEFIICTNTSSTTSSPQNVIDRETVPVTYDGANGSSDMVQVTCVPGSLTVPFTSAGAVKEATQLTVTLGMTVNGNAATVTSITASKSSNVDIYSNADSGYSTLSNNQRRIVVPADGTVSKADVNRGIVFAITGTYGSKSYTANYSFPMIASEQGAGGNGEDAWTLIVNPSSVIINQSMSNVNDFGLPIYIDFAAKRGNATATVGNVYNLNSSNLSTNMGLTVSASGNRLQITGYGKVSGSYVTYGRITCTVPLSFTDTGGTVHSTTFTVQIDVYVNLLGTWAVETTSSATTAAGSAIQTALGPNGAITSAYTAAINASAKGLRSEFNEVVAPGGNKNLFGFCKGCNITNSSWPSVPFIQGYGIVVNQNYSSRRRARISNLGTNGVCGCFTVSFQVKISSGTGSLNCNFCDVLPTVGEGTLLNNSQYVAVNTGWQSVELHFDLTDISASTQALLEASSFNGFFDIEDYDGTITNASANIYVRRLKIERGDTATAFCEADEDIAAIGQGQMIAQLTNNGMSYPISNNGRTNVYSVSVNPSGFSGSYVDYLYQNSGFILKSGKVYTLSFWARSSNAGVVITSYLYSPDIITSIGMELYGAEPGAAMESLSGDGGSRVRLSTTWTQYFLRFYVANSSSTPRSLIALRVEKGANTYTYGGSTYYYSGTIYISDIILQEGYVMDDTTFSSLISQNARRISLVQQSGLKRTGIDIESGKITLNADNTYVIGNFHTPNVISSNNEMITTITEGGIEIRSKTTLSYGVFRLNDQGEIILSMYDKDGNRVINLGGTPSLITNGEWVTWKLKKVNQGGNKAYYTTTESDCTTFYQLVLGQVTNTNSSIQYFLPPANNATQGVETTDSEVKSRNEMVFTSKGSGNSGSALETSIKGLTKISDGYYVKPNDGRFGVDANQNGPTNYWVTLYHFTNGKLDSTYKQQFGL